MADVSALPDPTRPIVQVQSLQSLGVDLARLELLRAAFRQQQPVIRPSKENEK